MELTEDELHRIERAEAGAYEALYLAAAPRLGTGSRRDGDVLAIWYPGEVEAGYNFLVNFHRAPDRDETYRAGRELLARRGARVIGIPIDERVADWGSTEKLETLGLRHESNETMWVKRIDPASASALPQAPPGFSIRDGEIDLVELEGVINSAWDLPAGHTRGRLFATAIDLPDWQVSIATAGDQVAAVSMLCGGEGIAILMLAVVMPAFRGRGLQTYFIQERLSRAAADGCSLAVSETDDDNASPRNLQRAGFQLLVNRAVFAREIP